MLLVVKIIFSVLFLLTILLQARTWTSADGKTLEAEFLSSTETEVTLKRLSDNKQFTLPLSRLSEDDQKFISEKKSAPPANESLAQTTIEGPFAHLITGDWALDTHGDLPYAFYGGKELSGSQKYPLIVFLHGRSDKEENGHQKNHFKSFIDKVDYDKNPYLVLAPLCYQPYGATGGGWDKAPGEDSLDFIKELAKKLPIIDPQRIYVVGYSMGGFGTWHFLKEEPRLFAAGVPIAGGASGVSKLRDKPIWAFHGAKDDSVPPDSARNCADELKRSEVFKYTEFPEADPGIINQVLRRDDLHTWLFEQRL